MGSEISMAKGTLYLMIANGTFALAGYLIHFGLGRYLGPVDYGIFGVILSLTNVLNTILTTGFPQSAAKYIAEDNARLRGITREANRIQLTIGLSLFALYFGLAGVIARWLNDPSLTPYIRISAVVIPTYALCGMYSGYLNGLRWFDKQAISILGHTFAKVALVFTLVLIGFGVKGAIAGYSLAAFIAFLLAWRFLRKVEKSHMSFGWNKLARFGVLATLFATMFFLLMNIDLFAVKALGVGGSEVGYYTAASTISKAPYTLFAGLAITLFPTISRVTSLNDTKATRNYIRQSMRYMLLLLIPSVVMISATSSDLITVVYSSRYIGAAAPLSILVFGLGLLSMFLVLANIIMSSGKPGIAMMLALLLLGIDIVLNILLVSSGGIVGAAWATTLTGLLGTSIASVYVFWRFNALVTIKSVGRICLASVVIYVTARHISLPVVWLPAIYVGLLALYAGLLWLMRELKSEDLTTFKRIVALEKFTGSTDLSP